MLHGERFNDCPSSVLKEPVEIRLARAKDPLSSPDLLRVLSNDRFWYVRDFVASNKNTPLDCLNALINDSDFRVRAEASKNLLEQSYSSKHISSLNNIIRASQVISSVSRPQTSEKSDLPDTKLDIEK